MRVVVIAAGTDPEADPTRPYRVKALVEGSDGVAHEVELLRRIWTCTCGGNCGHIAAVRPLAGQEVAVPVADGPVTMPVEDAIAVLDHHGIEGGYGGWTVVSVTETGRGRWRSTHQIVIRNERGEHFAASVEQGLTETQRAEPWGGEETVTFEPVMPRSRLTRAVEWVAPAKDGS